MIDPKPAVLAAVLLLAAGCRPSPCVACRATLIKGAGIGAYLATHPVPDKLVKEAEGGFTYTWMYLTETREAVPSSSVPTPAMQTKTGSYDFGSTPGGAASALLTLHSLEKDTGHQPPLFPAARKVTLVTARTDAARLVLSYTCDRVTLPGS